MRSTFALWICLFFVSVGTGQDFSQPWTLQSCIDHALKNNLSIKQGALNAEINEVNYLQSKANVLPSLNANLSHAYNFGRTIDPFTNQFATDRVLSQNFSLSSALILFNGFQNYNNIRQQKFNMLAGEQDLEKLKNDISLSIATAYLQVLFADELLEIAKGQYEITRLQAERTKKLADAGAVAKNVFLDIQAQLAAEELNVVNAENQLTMAYLNLGQLLDLSDMKNFKIVKPDLSPPAENLISSSPEEIYNSAISLLPDVKSAEYKLMAAEKGLAVSRGAMSPRLTLSGSLGTGYSGLSRKITSVQPTGSWDTTLYFSSSGDLIFVPTFNTSFETIPFREQYDQNVNRSVGLFLTIPLFNGLQTYSSVKRSKINMLNAKYSVDIAKQTLMKNIQQAWADAVAALKKYQATVKSLKALEESFSNTEKRFEVNLVNSYEYAEAKNRLARAKSDLSQAKYDYFFKLKVLDYYQGKPIKF